MEMKICGRIWRATKPKNVKVKLITAFIIVSFLFIKDNHRRRLYFKLDNNMSRESSETNHRLLKTSTQYAVDDDVPDVKVKHVTCSKLFSGDVRELTKAEEFHERYTHRERSAEELIEKTAHCEEFKISRKYLSKAVSKEEQQFPLAYSILFYKHIDQVERLLRSIYRPQNVYCLHVDAKSPAIIQKSASALANCFDNVFLASRSVSVYWGTYSVVEPDLVCMEDLLHRKRWRYFINLTGQEWPLQTNLDLVKIFKVFNGANDINGDYISKSKYKFIRDRIGYRWTKSGNITSKRKEPFAAGNMTMIKGAVHIAASRAFVDFVVNHRVARAFRTWCKDTGHASEHFFNSLEFSPQLGVPGAYTGSPPSTMSVNRWKKWKNFDYKCKGKYVRSICIPGVGDLRDIYNSRELFLNKLHLDYQPLVTDCLEELHFNRTRADIRGNRNFDAEFYKQRNFVKNYHQKAKASIS